MIVAELGKKRGTVKKEWSCLTGFGTAMITTIDGDEVGIVAPTMRGLEKIWNTLSIIPIDKTKVRRVVYFPHEALTTLRPRRKRTSDRGEKR
jgi:hypothetical protein